MVSSDLKLRLFCSTTVLLVIAAAYLISTASSLAEVIAPEAVTKFSKGLSRSPKQIIDGPDGNLWFIESDRRIGRITPNGVITEFSAGGAYSGSHSQPREIVAGPDGNLWFTESLGSGAIGRITPSGVVTHFHQGITAGSTDGITAGPDGNIWFTEGNGRIGRITPQGVITEFSIHAPLGIATGSDGNLWVTGYGPKMTQGDSYIAQVAPDGTIKKQFSSGITSTPDGGPVAGPDGNIWFTEVNSNQIGRITPDGIITEFPQVPGASFFSGRSGITAGPDGNIWFIKSSYSGKYQIGRISPGGVVTDFQGPFRDLHGILARPDGTIWVTEPDGISKINMNGLPSGAPGSSTRGDGKAVTKCRVPKLLGKRFVKATRLLKAAKCKLGKVTIKKSARRVKRSKLIVLAQKPKAGRKLVVNRHIRLTLGKRR